MRDDGAHGLVWQPETLLGGRGKSRVTVVPIPCFLRGAGVGFPPRPGTSTLGLWHRSVGPRLWGLRRRGLLPAFRRPTPGPPQLFSQAGVSRASVSPSVLWAGAAAGGTCVSVGPASLPGCYANASAHPCQPQQEAPAPSARARRGDGGDGGLSVSAAFLLPPPFSGCRGVPGVLPVGTETLAPRRWRGGG